jgi:hypothetical protein
VESDLSAIHRIRHPERLASQRFIDLAWRLVAYQGAVRHFLTQEADDQEGTQGPAGLDQDRTVAAEYADTDPVLSQFVEIGRVEVID